MDFCKTFEQNEKNINMTVKTDTMTMTYWPFFEYWLYAAFPQCHGLWTDLNNYFPYSQKWINQMFGNDKKQEVTPVCYTVIVDKRKITILMYRYHVEYRIEGQKVILPCLPYRAVQNLDNDTFLMLLPIVDAGAYNKYGYKEMKPDLLQRLPEMAFPAEHREYWESRFIRTLASDISIGLLDDDGAEEGPLWYIWQETADSLYGAGWWPYINELHLFQKLPDAIDRPDAYITAPEGENVFLWAERMLSEWISSPIKNLNDREFLSILQEKYGVMPPDKYDQDWEFTAGDSKHTEDYIDFYNKHPLSFRQKREMIHMIIQGFDDLIAEGLDRDSLNKIWDRIKIILLNEKQIHYEAIEYWSCMDTELEEDRFYVSKFIRELL